MDYAEPESSALSSESGPIAFIAKSLAGSPVPRFAEHPDENAYYFISLRLTDMRPGVIHTVDVPDYAGIRYLPIPSHWSRMNHGAVPEAWLAAGPEVIRAAYFPAYLVGLAEVVLLINPPGDSGDKADRLRGLRCATIPMPSAGPNRELTREGLLVRFPLPADLEAFFRPPALANGWHLMLHALGLRTEPRKRVLSLRARLSFNWHDQSVDPQNFPLAFDPRPAEAELHFSAVSSWYFHDSSDPIVCVPRPYAAAFEAELLGALRAKGFQIVIVPFLEPIAANWLASGVIPVLAGEPRSVDE